MIWQSNRWRSIAKFVRITLLACVFVVLMSSQGWAQFSPLFLSPTNDSQKVLGWDPNTAYECGRLVCSDVILKGALGHSFTLAKQRDPGEAKEEIAIAIEDRVNLVESTFSAIQQTMLDHRLNRLANETALPQRDRQFYRDRIWQYYRTFSWHSLDRQQRSSLELHPDTPTISIGQLNNQTVIFVPEQPDYGLPQQTIVTVTSFDLLSAGIRPSNNELIEPSDANSFFTSPTTEEPSDEETSNTNLSNENPSAENRNASIDALADRRRNVIQWRLSEALWGQDFDRQYPLDRVVIALIIVGVSIGFIALVDLLQQILRGVRRRLKQRSRDLQQALMHDRDAATMEGPIENDGPDPENTLFESSSSFPSKPPAAQDKKNLVSSSAAVNQPSLDSAFHLVRQLGTSLSSELEELIIKPIDAVEQAVVDQFHHLIQKVFLDQQSRIRQLRNVIQFLQRSLFWAEVVVLFASAMLITVMFSGSRLYAIFFLNQMIALPTIWMIISLLDIGIDFVTDRWLHQWAKSEQIEHSSSSRYALRVNTYSPAIQGATTMVFVTLGIYLTIRTFGINPSVLASAGVAAVVVAFLSRNLLEDMLNGALILWTDRYAIGDVIQVSNIIGLVENMNLYATQIRGAEGRLATIPNGQIRVVENLTKDWSRVDFKIEIAHNADIEKALEIIHEVAEHMRSEEPWNERILEPASILGVDAVTHAGILIQVWIRTQPIQQFAVGREFRLRIKQAFDQAGIALGIPQQEISYHNGIPIPKPSSTQNHVTLDK